jgi:selenide,water dikinase
MFPGVLEIADRNRSGGMGSNQEHFAPSTQMEPGVDRVRAIVLYDPQTSGGLLIAADPASVDEVAACLSRAGVPARLIGVCEAAKPGIAVRVKP